MKFLFEANNIGILKGNTIIEWEEGLTIVVGGNGTGKTTIFHALQEANKSSSIKLKLDGFSFFMPKELEFLSFISEDSLMFTQLLKNNYLTIKSFNLPEEEISLILSKSIGSVLKNKLDGFSKFGYKKWGENPFQLILSGWKSWKIIDSETKEDISDLFIAVGEQLCLGLVFVSTLRNYLSNYRLPLIIDCLGGRLDSYLRIIVTNYILSLKNVPILLIESPLSIPETLYNKVKYILLYDEKLKSSELIPADSNWRNLVGMNSFSFD